MLIAAQTAAGVWHRLFPVGLDSRVGLLRGILLCAGYQYLLLHPGQRQCLRRPILAGAPACIFGQLMHSARGPVTLLCSSEPTCIMHDWLSAPSLAPAVFCDSSDQPVT